jgi:uncharacterized membrane protein
MELILFWFIVSILVAVYASSRNRSGFGWFLISLIISPLISFLFLVILPKRAGYLGKSDFPQTLEDRLKEIERLKIENVLTEEEYQLKRKQIIETN